MIFFQKVFTNDSCIRVCHLWSFFTCIWFNRIIDLIWPFKTLVKFFCEKFLKLGRLNNLGH